MRTSKSGVERARSTVRLAERCPVGCAGFIIVSSTGYRISMISYSHGSLCCRWFAYMSLVRWYDYYDISNLMHGSVPTQSLPLLLYLSTLSSSILFSSSPFPSCTYQSFYHPFLKILFLLCYGKPLRFLYRRAIDRHR
jgi:hypothetical protein